MSDSFTKALASLSWLDARGVPRVRGIVERAGATNAVERDVALMCIVEC